MDIKFGLRQVSQQEHPKGEKVVAAGMILRDKAVAFMVETQEGKGPLKRFVFEVDNQTMLEIISRGMLWANQKLFSV